MPKKNTDFFFKIAGARGAQSLIRPGTMRRLRPPILSNTRCLAVFMMPRRKLRGLPTGAVSVGMLEP